MSPIIFDPRDTIVIGGIAVIVWPHPSGDSCATRRYVMRLHRSGADPWQLLVQELHDDGTYGPPLGAFAGPKEAPSGWLTCEPGQLVVHYSGKLDPDPGAPYVEMEERIAMPGVYPIDLTAAWRLRNVAGIVAKHLPAAAGELEPYVK